MAKVLGIGGIFIQLKGEKNQLKKWYFEHLGLEFTPYGVNFIDGNQLLLLSISGNEHKKAILNFRVDNIQTIFTDLKKENIQFVSEIRKYDYGSFCEFIDPFGNQIELWQANEEEYRKMVMEEENKEKNKK